MHAHIHTYITHIYIYVYIWYSPSNTHPKCVLYHKLQYFADILGSFFWIIFWDLFPHGCLEHFLEGGGTPPPKTYLLVNNLSAGWKGNAIYIYKVSSSSFLSCSLCSHIVTKCHKITKVGNNKILPKVRVDYPPPFLIFLVHDTRKGARIIVPPARRATPQTLARS